jgi:hypothetical protein
MRSFKPLIACLGIAVALPALAEVPKGDYSAPRPESDVETAAVRAEAGAKPAEAVGRQERKTTKIASVDRIKKAISSL